MNLFLDTSCLVSFYLFDSHSTKARTILEKIANGKISGVVSALSLVELGGAVRRISNEKIAREIMSEMAEMVGNGLIKVVPLGNSDAIVAAELAISTALKGADAVVVSSAKQAECELFTFDEEIKEKARGVVEFYED